MLEDYCKSLSDRAQLEIALRLGTLALPAWESFFEKNENALSMLNQLIGDSNRVQGGAQSIDADFPRRALSKIERSLKNAEKKGPHPVPFMKSDGTLTPLLATSMQPLTNPAWDDTLPYTVRLAFTLVWNILAWILYERVSHTGETHIYVAINQAADVLMTENFLSIKEIEAILTEYRDKARGEDEDSAWESAAAVKEHDSLSMDEIYRKIIGEKIVKDAAGGDLAKEVLRQMREEDRSFWDSWGEYYSGTSITYSYNKEKRCYWRSEIDVVALSFADEYPMSEQEMRDFISGVSLSDLRKAGFEV